MTALDFRSLFRVPTEAQKRLYAIIEACTILDTALARKDRAAANQAQKKLNRVLLRYLMDQVESDGQP
jgi:hypothetical protein